MNVRLVCVLASSSCIGTELAADIAENVVFRKCDFRRVADALAADTVAKKGAAARLRVDDAYEEMQHSGDGGRGGACSRRLEDGTPQNRAAATQPVPSPRQIPAANREVFLASQYEV